MIKWWKGISEEFKEPEWLPRWRRAPLLYSTILFFDRNTYMLALIWIDHIENTADNTCFTLKPFKRGTIC